MKLLFATGNTNKANEIQRVLPKEIEIITLKDIELKDDIPETSDTIRGNALQKANYIKMHFNIDCFADDTGLEIMSLNGDPGVYSARYAGDKRNDQDNMNLVLERLKTHTNRSARFKTVIVLELNGTTHEFEGIVNGTILSEKRGKNGFGYDPIFEPENCGKSFAEMSIDEKNKYSHRARATVKMIRFLIKQIQ
jgi:XTP/dITP diphosphohydrolase